MSEIAIQGAVIDYKPTKDGGGWVKVEFDELQWAHFRESFPSGVNYFVAVVRLSDDSSQITSAGP